MTSVLSFILKTTAILAIGLLSAAMLRRRSAALKHCVLCVTIFFSAIVPLMSWFMPPWPVVRLKAVSSWPIPNEWQRFETVADQQPTLFVPPSNILTAEKLIEILWSAGFIVSVVVLLAGMLRLRRIAAAASPTGSWDDLSATISTKYGLRHPVALLQSRNPAILVTWGILNPKILLPAHSDDWPKDRIRAALCHELAHVRRCDWLVQTTAEVVKAVYWFNPLLWFVCNRLRLESEYACDDAVLAQGISGVVYARHLLDVVQSLQNPDRSWSRAVSMARPSTVERRFQAMLNSAIDRTPLSRSAIFWIVFLIVGVTLPIAGLSASARVIELSPLPSVRSVSITPAISSVPSAAPAAAEHFVVRKQSPIPPSPVMAQAPQYRGEIESFDLKSLDLKDFFRLIANFSGLNIILDPGVSGTVTMTLIDVPWDQALDVVLKTHQLSSRLQGNILRIATNDFLQAEETARQPNGDRDRAADLVTQRRILNYARSDAVAVTLSKMITARGSVVQDPDRNAVIITDIQARFATIDRILELLDTPAPTTGPFAKEVYVIKSGDSLAIFVFKEPALSVHVTVREDGRISVPLLGDIPAKGLSPGELKRIIEGRLAGKYLADPNVTVIVQ